VNKCLAVSKYSLVVLIDFHFFPFDLAPPKRLREGAVKKVKQKNLGKTMPAGRQASTHTPTLSSLFCRACAPS